MDSIFILQYGNDGGIISVYYDEDEANEALRDLMVAWKALATFSSLSPEYTDAYVEQRFVA
jgi:hypothetical protein